MRTDFDTLRMFVVERAINADNLDYEFFGREFIQTENGEINFMMMNDLTPLEVLREVQKNERLATGDVATKQYSRELCNRLIKDRIRSHLLQHELKTVKGLCAHSKTKLQRLIAQLEGFSLKYSISRMA